MKEYIVTPDKKQKIMNQWNQIIYQKDLKINELQEEIKPLKNYNVNLTIENNVLMLFALLLTLLLFSKQIKLIISKIFIKN